MKKYDDLVKNLKNDEYILLKSKDDLTFEHNKNTLLYKLTGFSGTAGEAIIDNKSKITLFVDPRYHIQADNETKDKYIDVIKLDMQTSAVQAFKRFLENKKVLYIPSKSTRLSYFNILQKALSFIKIIPYDTEDEMENLANIEEISLEISGMPYSKKIEKLRKKIKGQNLFVSSLEDVSYILNLRSFDIKNTSVIKAKLLILEDKTVLFSNDKIPALKEIEVHPFYKMKNILSKINEPVLIDENTISLNDYNLIKNPK